MPEKSLTRQPEHLMTAHIVNNNIYNFLTACFAVPQWLKNQLSQVWKTC